MNWATMAAVALALAGCAKSEATRTSANSMMIDTGAAPVCGTAGAAKVAAKTAAIETIKAGFDRYIIGGAAAQNNVTATQLPGQSQTSGQLYRGGGFNATTTYQPGPVIFSGTHDRQLSVVMFRPGDPGFEQAIDAREQLGPEWAELVRNGVRTCL